MKGHAPADTDMRRGRHAPVLANVRDIGDIDEALIRPGRAFAVVRTRGLSREEAASFVRKSVTLAELYRVMNT